MTAQEWTEKAANLLRFEIKAPKQENITYEKAKSYNLPTPQLKGTVMGLLNVKSKKRLLQLVPEAEKYNLNTRDGWLRLYTDSVNSMRL